MMQFLSATLPLVVQPFSPRSGGGLAWWIAVPAMVVIVGVFLYKFWKAGR